MKPHEPRSTINPMTATFSTAYPPSRADSPPATLLVAEGRLPCRHLYWTACAMPTAQSTTAAQRRRPTSCGQLRRVDNEVTASRRSMRTGYMGDASQPNFARNGRSQRPASPVFRDLRRDTASPTRRNRWRETVRIQHIQGLHATS